MNVQIFDFVIVILFLYEGITMIKTGTMRDKRNRYTEESKAKAARPVGSMFVLVGIIEAVMTILKLKGILKPASEVGITKEYLMLYIPMLVIIAIGIIWMIAVLKKKK